MMKSVSGNKGVVKIKHPKKFRIASDEDSREDLFKKNKREKNPKNYNWDNQDEQ
jgi:hypothetical protein